MREYIFMNMYHPYVTQFVNASANTHLAQRELNSMWVSTILPDRPIGGIKRDGNMNTIECLIVARA